MSFPSEIVEQLFVCDFSKHILGLTCKKYYAKYISGRARLYCDAVAMTSLHKYIKHIKHKNSGMLKTFIDMYLSYNYSWAAVGWWTGSYNVNHENPAGIVNYIIKNDDYKLAELMLAPLNGTDVSAIADRPKLYVPLLRLVAVFDPDEYDKFSECLPDEYFDECVAWLHFDVKRGHITDYNCELSVKSLYDAYG